MSDEIPTYVVRPGDGADSVSAKPAEKPRKLSYDDLYKRALDLGYSKAGAAGIARNFMRESKGDTAAIGDGGTSRGLGQWHESRKADLEAYAKAQKADPDDPDVQFGFMDKELREKYPALRASLVQARDADGAEDAFKRVYERPASVMWDNNPNLSSGRYRFSDYALKEHDGRRNTSVVYMPPQDYLDLSPGFEETPFDSQSGRALKASVGRGEEIESVPSLDVRVSGPTATVTDQDGRHRALLAQQEGIDAIPVAVRQSGRGEPTEIQGMTGAVMPYDYRPAKQVPRSLLQRAGDAVIGRAEAAEPKDDDPYAKFAGAGEDDDPYAKFSATPDKPAPDNMAVSALKGAAAGFGRTVLGGQELLGKGLEAVGATGAGQWLTDDARAGIKRLDAETAADREAHPYVTGAGEIVGSMALPGGAGLKIGGNALKAGAITGALSGAIEPGNPDHYWAGKAVQIGGGAALGAAGNALAAKVAEAINPAIRPVYEFVKKVTGQDISKSPGALAVVKRMERDAGAGGATAQDMIDISNALPDKPLTIADLGGPEILGLTGRVARKPGESRSTLTNFLTERDRAAGTRLAADVDRGIGRGSAYDAADALRKSRAAAARPAYDAAYSHPAINPDEMAANGRIGSLLSRPSVKSGMANARKIAAEEGVDLKTQGVDLDAEGFPVFVDVPTWRALDYIKRGLDDVVEQYRDRTTNKLVLDTYGRAADQTRTEFRQALKDLNPEYRAALESYSGPSASLDAMAAGQDFMTQRPEEIARRLASLGPGDREFYKLGAADTLRARLAKKALSADESKAVINSQYMRDQLRPLFDSEDAYHRFLSSVLSERRMFETKSAALGGSQTAGRLAEDETPEMDALGHAARMLASARSHNALGTGANALKALSSLISMRDPKTNAEIADILTTPLARGDVQSRLNNFYGFMAALPNTRTALQTNSANALRAAGPFAGAGLAQIPTMIVRPRPDQ